VILSLLASSYSGLLEIILAIIAASGPVFVAIITVRSRRAAKVVIQSVHEKLDYAVGIPNGHGPLMDQTTELLNNQIKMHGHLYELNDKLSNHIESSKKDIDDLHEKFDTLSKKVEYHIDWEENRKYKPKDNENKK
jgi:predicted RNase H-like nuclease (RuvC/YqgF family)